MHLFDKILDVHGGLMGKLRYTCPRCGSKSLTCDMSERFPEAECDICHLRIKITTRNNERLTFLAFAVTAAFFIGAILL